VRAKYEQGARKPRANGDEPVSRERTSQRGRGSEMALVACVFIYEAGINSDSDDRFWTLKVGGYPGCFINFACRAYYVTWFNNFCANYAHATRALVSATSYSWDQHK
jgi:hypothetical protein